MATQGENQRVLQLIAAFRSEVTSLLGGELAGNTPLIDEIDREFSELRDAVYEAGMAEVPPPDKGLADLVGVGPEAAGELGDDPRPAGVEPVRRDRHLRADRRRRRPLLHLPARADRRLPRRAEAAGAVPRPAPCGCRPARARSGSTSSTAARCCATPGATGWPPTAACSATARRPLRAARGRTPTSTACSPTSSTRSPLFWRDKRISDVIRERAYDPSFGSIAIVRRAGLDLRNNLKFTSFGHLNVLRVEVMQLLDEAFRILERDDVKRLFGADNAWDVIEEVLVRYFRQSASSTSPRQRMAVAGREILRWLAQPHILRGAARPQFEALLLEIAEYAEEWLTSAQAIGVARRGPRATLATAGRVRPSLIPPPRANGSRVRPERVYENEW